MTKFLAADHDRTTPAPETGEESLGELLLECHTFLSALLERQHGPWVGQDAQHLLERLGALVEWETIH